MTAPKPTNTILYLDGVEVSFDGYKALRGLSLALAPGEMRAIIGPNGAGKTTMMDVVTGKTRPDDGDAVFDGVHNLLDLDEAAIADLGIGRKFQKPTVFESHTVADNVLLALKGARTTATSLFGWRNRVPTERIDAILTTVGLLAHRGRMAADLSHGQKQWLEIGMLLAQDPKVLLVDEPVAGMTHHEVQHTAELLLRLAGEHTVVVIEHDMDFVRSIARRVTVLHEGSVLAEGSMEQVQRDPRVVEVYLGE